MTCDDLHPFVDGELSDADAESYREHLAGCARCQDQLPAVLALAERFAELREAEAPIVDARPPIVDARADVVPLERARARRRLPALAIAGGLLALAAGVALVIGRGRGHRPPAPVELLAAADKRPTLARFSYPGAAVYHPYDPARGAGDAASIPMATLARLERAGDWHGLAVASFLAGHPAEADTYLAKAPVTDDVAVDGAAMTIATSADPNQLAPALDALDAVIRRNPAHAAARWNRAQALARLGLARTAAAAFDELAALAEPGWSDEAARTAASLRATIAGEQDGWNADWTAGLQMVGGGPLPPAGKAAARPGIFRLMFYDAVRSAPSADRVRALRPLAVELDASSGGDALTRYADRIIALPAAAFTARAPLAARYRAMVVDDAPPADRERFLADLRRAGPAAADLLLGALYWPGPIERHRAEYDALAAATGDPWFAAIVGHQTGKAALAGGDLHAAEVALTGALHAAEQARVFYRADLIAIDLAGLLLALDRLPDAASVAGHAFTSARADGEAGHATSALPWLGQIALPRFQLGLAAAYFREEDAAAAGGDCASQRHARVMLAESLALAADYPPARAALARAPRCADAPVDIPALWVAIVLWRHGGTDADADAIAAELTGARPADGGAAILVEALTGALAIERTDPARHADGRARLADAIARADAAPVATSPLAPQARGWAYALLAVDSARRGDFRAVLDLTAAEQEHPAPAGCAVALVIEDERRAVAAVDELGQVAGAFDPAWPHPNALPAGAAAIPADLADRLRRCPEVTVYGQAPIEGTPALLPADVAWSFARSPSKVAAAPVPPLRVRVSGVLAPGRAVLPPLPPIVDPAAHVLELAGASATPARVLAAIGAATAIELHTHGLHDRERSDASYLALSPDADGDFALTAARLDGALLRGHPIVTLAACGSARGEPYLHQPDSLPAAFIRAGARAVLATADDIPDEEATRFFAAVNARAAAGASLAIALRDERLAWLRRDPASWTRDVMLYQ